MTSDLFTLQGFIELFKTGGMVMPPLMICSLLVWGIIFERFWRYHRLKKDLEGFRLEAMNALLKKDYTAAQELCQKSLYLPSAEILLIGLKRLGSKDSPLRKKWIEAMERKRHETNQGLRRNLWVLGTIGSASPFIGLFGTVVGILRSFQEIAKSGSGGFVVVAAGISEALIATAAGIFVAVVAVMAFNAFQTRCARLIFLIRLQIEEFAEVLTLHQDGQNVD